MPVLEEDLTRTFAALADPTRLAILGRLATGDASVTELAKPFALTQQAISKHLRVLQDAGLITRSQDAQRRPCRLAPDALAPAVEWITTQRQMWAERYDRLDDHLADLNRVGRHRSG